VKQAASDYRGEEALILTNYNKSKHGAPVIRTGRLDRTEFFVLSPQRDTELEGRYLFSKFSCRHL
jgi:hypothetical protein